MKRIIFIWLILQNGFVFAQWSTDPNINLQVSTWGQYPVACTDGEGGVYIRWEQNSYTTDQYIQHVNKYGYVRWATPVEVYGTQNGTVFEGKICPDDSNGVIVLFTEWNVNGDDPQYFTHKRVCVNRLDSNGNKLWGEYGVRVSLRDTSQALREIVTDGQKGCIVAFLVAPDSLYVQRISSTSQRMWGEEGIFVHKLGTYGEISAVTDCNNGIILNYWESTTQTTRFQRRNGNGNILWTKISATPYTLMKSDGYGGLLLSMNRYNYGEDRIIINRMHPDGTFRWGVYGITLDDSVGNYSTVTNMTLRNDSVMIVYWTHIKDIHNDKQAKFQLINSEGQFLLDSEGVNPSLVPVDNRGASGFFIDDSNNFVFIFGDDRNSSQSEIFCQKFNSTGVRLWDSLDVLFSSVYIAHFSVLQGCDGGIIVGDDAPLNGIFAHYINKNGYVGIVVDVENSDIKTEKTFTLYQNYPNPFNASTTIKYTILKSDKVELKLYNVLGQEVKVLISQFQTQGDYIVNLDMSGLSSGLYIYRLSTSSGKISKKLLLVK